MNNKELFEKHKAELFAFLTDKGSGPIAADWLDDKGSPNAELIRATWRIKELQAELAPLLKLQENAMRVEDLKFSGLRATISDDGYLELEGYLNQFNNCRNIINGVTGLISKIAVVHGQHGDSTTTRFFSNEFLSKIPVLEVLPSQGRWGWGNFWQELERCPHFGDLREVILRCRSVPDLDNMPSLRKVTSIGDHLGNISPTAVERFRDARFTGRIDNIVIESPAKFHMDREKPYVPFGRNHLNQLILAAKSSTTIEIKYGVSFSDPREEKIEIIKITADKRAKNKARGELRRAGLPAGQIELG